LEILERVLKAEGKGGDGIWAQLWFWFAKAGERPVCPWVVPGQDILLCPMNPVFLLGA